MTPEVKTTPAGLATPAPVAPSPTGTPVVKPSLVPLFIMILVALGGALAALEQSPGVSPTVKTIAMVLVPLIGSILATLSPGLRKSDGAATVSK